MINELPIKNLEIIIGNADNYEWIRLEAVRIFQSWKPNILGISDKGRIFYNPFRVYVFDTSNEDKTEKLFDIEVFDKGIDYSLLKLYKKCFVRAFDNLLKEGKLYTAERILQWEW